jgi:hypothetical protein
MFSEPDEHGNRRHVSIYYFLLEHYRPTLGPPSVQGEDWTISRDQLRRMAGENEALWRVYLTWSALLTNLQANELIDDVDAGRLAAHCRFLSGFAHPVTDQRRNVYGNDALLGWPKYDHYSSELVLLYAIRLGSVELWHFIRAIEQRTGAHLADPDEVIKMLEAAETATSYFWFLGAHPTPTTRGRRTMRRLSERCKQAERPNCLQNPPRKTCRTQPIRFDVWSRCIAVRTSS